MKVIEKYTGTKTYMFPNGDIATPEKVISKFPAALAFVHIVETDENGEVMFAFQNLSAMRSMYSVDPALSEDEAIAAIQTIVNTPETIEETGPSPEERIAAALEYQMIASMPDEI